MNLLAEINVNHRFRDPIHGFIWLNDAELKIIDTLIFQRLRRVHQLALTKYVYPTAEHSRFVHSLGVLQAATNIFLEILKYSDSQGYFGKNNKERIAFFKTLRFATLMHDIGHPPFSHAAENEFLSDGIRHEDVSSYIINNYKPISSIIQKEGVEPKIVGGLLTDKYKKEYSIIKKIISGQFDADRADYLLRDSHICGVKYGEYDYYRYIQSFIVDIVDDDICLNINEKNVSIMESFLMARYHYNLQIPYHRTRTGLDIVLKKYIKKLRTQERIREFVTKDKGSSKTIKIKEMDFDYFEDLDDYEIFNNIKQDNRGNNYWAKILMRSDHLVPILDIKSCGEGDSLKYKSFIKKLKDSQYKEDEDFFRYKKNLKFSNFADSSEKQGEKKENTIFVLNSNKEKICDIVKYSPVFNQLISPVKLYRVYVKGCHKESAQSIYMNVCSHFNELRDV